MRHALIQSVTICHSSFYAYVIPLIYNNLDQLDIVIKVIDVTTKFIRISVGIEDVDDIDEPEFASESYDIPDEFPDDNAYLDEEEDDMDYTGEDV